MELLGAALHNRSSLSFCRALIAVFGAGNSAYVVDTKSTCELHKIDSTTELHLHKTACFVQNCTVHLQSTRHCICHHLLANIMTR